MPFVMVTYDPEFASKEDDVVFTRLKKTICEAAARELTVSEHPLTTEEFSIQFFEASHPQDQLTCDLQIRIFAHDFPERLLEIDDRAERICKEVTTGLERLWAYFPEEIGCSVSLFLSPMGYHSATFAPQLEGHGSR